MSVLTWTEAVALGGLPLSERLRRIQTSHHAMWNYVTYRDAIALLGLEPTAIYPEGSTRLDPTEWAGAAGYEPVSVTADAHRIYRVGRLRRVRERSAAP